ncbi:MAG: glycosyltransferase family 4 protein [Pseudomonadota bacterium]
MNLLYLSDSYIPSSMANSVHVMKMCNAFANGGHDITLSCYIESDDQESIFVAYEASPQIKLFDIGTTGVAGLRRIFRTFVYRKIAASNRRFDLIYSRDIYSLIGALSSGIPCIFEAHTPPRTRLDHHAFHYVSKHRSFARLVVITQALKDAFLEQYDYLTPEQIVVAHDGADLPNPDVKSANLGRDNVPQLGYVGSLKPGKGAEIVCELAGSLPEYDFHIVGGEVHQVDALRDAYPHTNLTLHGHVSHAEVNKYLKALDVALFPMQSSVIVSGGTDIAKWTSPLKLFEYMAAGKPIVASDFSVIREILTSETNALLVPATDMQQWQLAIQKLCGSDALSKKLGTQAHHDLSSRYTWQVRSANVIQGL